MKMIIFILLVGMTAYGADQSNTQPGNGSSANNLKCGNTVQNCNCKATEKIVKVEDTARIRRLEAQIAKLQAENEVIRKDNDKLLTAVRTSEDNIIEVTRVVKEKRYNDAISLIGGTSKTDLQVKQTGNTYDARNQYEATVGLMYQHDFDRVRGSLGITVNGIGFLGAGYSF